MKREIDIVEAYNMMDYTVSDIKDLRKNVEGEFHIWFQDRVRIAEEIGAGVRYGVLQGQILQCQDLYRETSTSS